MTSYLLYNIFLFKAITRHVRHDGKKEVLEKKLKELEEKERQELEKQRLIEFLCCRGPDTVGFGIAFYLFHKTYTGDSRYLDFGYLE